MVGVKGCVVECVVSGLKAEPVKMSFNVSIDGKFSNGIVVSPNGGYARASRMLMADLVEIWYRNFDDGVKHLFPEQEIVEEAAAPIEEEVEESYGIPEFLLRIQAERKARRFAF